jgi:hypothetical protein
MFFGLSEVLTKARAGLSIVGVSRQEKITDKTTSRSLFVFLSFFRRLSRRFWVQLPMATMTFTNGVRWSLPDEN